MSSIVKFVKENTNLVSKDDYHKLPNDWGVYFFLDKDFFPLYIGMSIRIKERIYSHLRGKEEKKKRLLLQTSKLAYISTSGELSTRLLESKLIKRLKPVFNKQLRKEKFLVVIKLVLDTNGYLQIRKERRKSNVELDFSKTFCVFRTERQLKEVLSNICYKEKLCPKLCGLENTVGKCFSYYLGKCSGACAGEISPQIYNEALTAALKNYLVLNWDSKELVYSESRGALKDEFEILNWSIFKHESSYIPINLADENFNIDTYKIIRRVIIK